jgi:glycosyltransferase involved in cell wall biosynthesis
VVHSPVAVGSSGLYCPHPLYAVGMQTKDIPRLEGDFDRFAVIFGRIEPYKSIETFLDLAADSLPLVVVGPASSTAYAQKILAYGTASVIVHPQQVDTARVASLLRRSDGLILTSTMPASHVSGSFFFAVSCAVPVWSLRTPFFDWFGRQFPEYPLHLFDSLELLMSELGRHLIGARERVPSDLGLDHFSEERLSAALEECLREPGPTGL